MKIPWFLGTLGYFIHPPCRDIQCRRPGNYIVFSLHRGRPRNLLLHGQYLGSFISDHRFDHSEIQPSGISDRLFWEQTGKFPMVLWRIVSYDGQPAMFLCPGVKWNFQKKIDLHRSFRTNIRRNPAWLHAMSSYRKFQVWIHHLISTSAKNSPKMKKTLLPQSKPPSSPSKKHGMMNLLKMSLVWKLLQRWFSDTFGLDVLITDDWAVDRWHSLWSWRFTAMCSCSSCAETQQIYVPHVQILYDYINNVHISYDCIISCRKYKCMWIIYIYIQYMLYIYHNKPLGLPLPSSTGLYQTLYPNERTCQKRHCSWTSHSYKQTSGHLSSGFTSWSWSGRWKTLRLFWFGVACFEEVWMDWRFKWKKRMWLFSWIAGH